MTPRPRSRPRPPQLVHPDLVEMALDLRRCLAVVQAAKADELLPPLVGALGVGFELWRRSAELHLRTADPEG